MGTDSTYNTSCTTEFSVLNIQPDFPRYKCHSFDKIVQYSLYVEVVPIKYYIYMLIHAYIVVVIAVNTIYIVIIPNV